jgi:hypothetical protein
MPVTITRSDVKIMLSQFILTPTLVPAVPTVTQMTDVYAVLGTNNQPLGGGMFGNRQVTYAPNDQEQTALAPFLAAIISQLPAALDSVIIANADGSNPQTVDRFWVESPIEVSPVFDNQGKLSLKDSTLSVVVSRRDSAGAVYDTVTVSRVIGPGGWALNQTTAGVLIASKRARLRTIERFVS